MGGARPISRSREIGIARYPSNADGDCHMAGSLEKLVSIGGAALSSAEPEFDVHLPPPLASELLELLRRKNGFYAFESALHLFPAQSNGLEIGLAEWNSPELWIDEYQGMANGCVFFAEDVFGCQFCIKRNAIHSFDPETGLLKHIADNLEDWAGAILRDYKMLTGYPLCHEWQQVNGRLAPGVRLVSKTPFVMGGKFSLENLYALDAVKGMRLRGHIAVQIKDLPDGAQVKLRVVD